MNTTSGIYVVHGAASLRSAHLSTDHAAAQFVESQCTDGTGVVITTLCNKQVVNTIITELEYYFDNQYGQTFESLMSHTCKSCRTKYERIWK